MVSKRFGGDAPRCLLSRAEAREMDRRAIEHWGIPGLLLMEHAARGAFEALVEWLPDRLDRVLVVGGPGNNGGDGWALCRHLLLAGVRPRGLLVGMPERLRGDASTNWEASRRMGVELQAVRPEEAAARIEALAAEASLLVDALFGTGLDRPVRGGYAEALAAMEAAQSPVVALDVPSGVCADSGQLLGPAPRCILTVSFGALKRGLLQHPGRSRAGRLQVASIGVPPPSSASVLRFGVEEATTRLAPRPSDAHKGSAGRVLVVAGSPGKGGAAALAARGALRGGAGLVTVASRAPWAAHGVPGLPEAMTLPLPESAEAAIELVLGEAERADVLVVGPGLGLDAVAARLVERIARDAPVPAVLDADALTLLAEGRLNALRDAAAPRWLTPHPGEAGRLLERSVDWVQRDRYLAARELAERTGQLVVLKGAGTVVAPALDEGASLLCPHGTAALATGGTGDVLAGLCAALMAAEGSDPEVAASAVVLHSIAGEYAARGSDRGVLAHEVADQIPIVFSELLSNPRSGLPSTTSRSTLSHR